MTVKDHKLNDLLDERQDLVGNICDLKCKLRGVEYKVKKTLMNAGQADLLSVNWRRVTRNRYG